MQGYFKKLIRAEKKEKLLPESENCYKGICSISFKHMK